MPPKVLKLLKCFGLFEKNNPNNCVIIPDHHPVAPTDDLDKMQNNPLMKEPEKYSKVYHHAVLASSAAKHFADVCALCNKDIAGKDAFMKGGLQAFCSQGCRSDQIKLDKTSGLEFSPPSPSPSPSPEINGEQTVKNKGLITLKSTPV